METKNNLLSNLCSACCFGQNYSRYKDAEKDGVQKGSNEGEGLILGGTWVIGAKEQGILFEFKAKSWSCNVCKDAKNELETAIQSIGGGEPPLVTTVRADNSMPN
mmetsp:Transcript_29941/g.46961  ORF Transcript_29941/g.46961 Transcript_29941/m.46961 type:complete len:105 (+) Transcript_29941:344-658(+)